MRPGWIDRSENGRVTIEMRVLDEQQGYGTQADQFPVGQAHEPLRPMFSGVLGDDNEIRLDGLGPSDNGIVRREVPRCGYRHLDAVQAQTIRHGLQSANGGLTGIDLQRCKKLFRTDERRRIHLGREHVEELQARSVRPGELRRLEHGGNRAAVGLLDGYQNLTNGRHR